VNCDDKKIDGPFGEKNSQKSRNSCLANGGGAGAHGHLTRGSNGLSPGAKYKRSRNVSRVTSIALIVVCLCLELQRLLVQSLIGNPSTLVAAQNRHFAYVKHIEFLSKLLDYVLRSNKSHINQSWYGLVRVVSVR